VSARGIGEGVLARLVWMAAIVLALGVSGRSAAQEAKPAPAKPNILVIMGDDIGYWNISAYNMGMMGYKTPNIDSVAKSGMIFTDAYAQQSCTAGRAAFITGQSPFRTGLLKVGLPGADVGLRPEDPTLAELLKPMGYTSGQFGKNHLGDKDEFLPTNHGFDEFFGNLYHLNAEEEPEHADYPKDPEFKKRFGPRGVIHSWAGGKIEDTGPLTRKRMETVDEEFAKAAIDFMGRAHKDGKPFFVWFNTTRMHIWTHLSKQWEGKSGLGVYPDGMLQHDHDVGMVLAALDQLGIRNDTIVIYTTDNGAEVFSWPDGGTTPFRSEKNTNWEGGYRVPFMVSWPGHIQPGSVSNGIVSLEDVVPTLMAAAGDPNIKEDLLKGHKAAGKTFKVHLDGYNLLPVLEGKAADPRQDFFYFNDEGQLVALRYKQWKLVFAEQRAHGFDVWVEPFVALRTPKLFNLRSDPFEVGDHEAADYPHWFVDHLFVLVPAQAYVAKFLATFKEFPPRQKSGSFSIDQVLESLQTSTGPSS
jgi:arylsulfatase A-like enzyme